MNYLIVAMLTLLRGSLAEASQRCLGFDPNAGK